jgi:hypothetical protein
LSTDLATTPEKGLQPRRSTDVLDFVQHMDKLWDLASILVKSSMLPQSIKTPEAAVAIILKGKELGIGPMAAFAGITVIQGKPVVSPQLMLSLINRDGVLTDIKIEDDGETCRVTMKRQGRSSHTASFSMADAQAMQLAGKDNWRKMPAIMRQWRAVAACARVVCPDVIDGMYTPEEMGASVDEDGAIIDGEIIAEAVPAPAFEPPQRHALGKNNLHPNNSGFHNGQYAKPDDTTKYLDKLKEKLFGTDEVPGGLNGQWADFWQDRRTGEFPAVKACTNDLMTLMGADGHIVKWLVETGQIDQDALQSVGKAANLGRHGAIIFSRSAADVAAMSREINDYMVKTFSDKKESIYRKHPELAPDGWADEQDEACEPGYAPPEDAVGT